MRTDVFTISELNEVIKDVVSSGFPASIWVCGEIQNLDRYKSKAHLFFDLVEKDAGAKDIKAKLGVTIWAGVRQKIEALLRGAENAFELKDGIEVKFSGKVDFYPPYGTLRFVIDNIDPIYTLGKIAQDRQRLIAELARDGVLERNKRMPMPVLPLRIGLISAYDSAAYNDFMHELDRSGFAFQVFFINAVMQGKNCESSVCLGLKKLDQSGDLDVIVITRGGGSIAELSAFDSRMIALGIAASKYPLITGIGHEINTSVSDLAAHTFVKTPTAAAQFLVEKVKISLAVLDERLEELLIITQRFVVNEQAGLKQDALRLQEMIRKMLEVHKNAQIRLTQKLFQLPSVLCISRRHSLLLKRDSLRRSIDLRFKSACVTISSLDQLAGMASPSRILKRGFSITRLASGKLVRSSDDVQPGDALATELHHSRITSMVT